MKLKRFLLIYLFLISVIIIIDFPAFASDEIILKNKKVIRGTILKSDKSGICIELPDTKAILTIATKDIFKVNSPKPDLLIFTDNYFLLGDYTQAYKAYLNLIEKYGGFSWGEEAYFKATRCLAKTGQTSKAIELCKEFIEGYPKAENINKFKLNLANIFFKEKNYSKAINLYIELTMSEDESKHAEIYYKLGESYFAQDEFEKALISFLKIDVFYYQATDWVVKAKFRSAECYEKLDEDLRAIKTYEEIVGEFPVSEFASKSKSKLENLKERRKNNVEQK